MLALTVTCRPHWRPWLDHQLAKQEHPLTLIVYDDSSGPQEWPPGAIVVRGSNRLQLTLGQKRQSLLDVAPPEPFAWFDDDDWHPKERLTVASALLDHVDVVGCRSGLFCDVQTLQTRRLRLDDVCFNSAVFGPYALRHQFQPLTRGEDTCWMQSVLKRATIASSPLLSHVWMSHTGNVTGKRGSMSFEGPKFSKLDSWERKFLSDLSV